MSWFGNYLKSSIGAKHVMAVSGLLLVGFVLVHMVGNLQIFMGAEAINAYAANLKALGPLLWVARGGLLVIFLVHIVSALRLVSLNKAARPVGYKKTSYDRSSFAGRVMFMSGVIVLAFVVFHLVHFTFGGGGGVLAANFNQIDPLGRHDVYNMMVRGFQIPAVSITYIVAMVLLCLHLKHGVSSLFQSLGLNHPKYNGIFQMAGPVIAALVLVGNVAMPVAVLAGFVKVQA